MSARHSSLSKDSSAGPSIACHVQSGKFFDKKKKTFVQTLQRHTKHGIPAKNGGSMTSFSTLQDAGLPAEHKLAVSGFEIAPLRCLDECYKDWRHSRTESYKPSKPGAVAAACEIINKKATELNSCELTCRESTMPKRLFDWSIRFCPNLTRLRLPLHWTSSAQACAAM